MTQYSVYKDFKCNIIWLVSIFTLPVCATDTGGIVHRLAGRAICSFGKGSRAYQSHEH